MVLRLQLGNLPHLVLDHSNLVLNWLQQMCSRGNGVCCSRQENGNIILQLCQHPMAQIQLCLKVRQLLQREENVLERRMWRGHEAVRCTRGKTLLDLFKLELKYQSASILDSVVREIMWKFKSADMLTRLHLILSVTYNMIWQPYLSLDRVGHLTC